MTQKFDQEFKDNAVRMALESTVTQRQLAADLGIGISTLTSWIRAYRAGNKIHSGQTPEQKEIRRLKRENEVVSRIMCKFGLALSSFSLYLGCLL